MSNNFVDVNFHHQGSHDPSVRGTVGSGLSRQFHRHLKILNLIMFGHLVAVLANVHNRWMDTPRPPTPPPDPSCSISMRQFHRHLKILNMIIFGHLVAVLANVHNRRMDRLCKMYRNYLPPT